MQSRPLSRPRSSAGRNEKKLDRASGCVVGLPRGARSLRVEKMWLDSEWEVHSLFVTVDLEMVSTRQRPVLLQIFHARTRAAWRWTMNATPRASATSSMIHGPALGYQPATIPIVSFVIITMILVTHSLCGARFFFPVINL